MKLKSTNVKSARFLLVFFLMLFLCKAVSAASYSWNGGSGTWSTTTAWTPTAPTGGPGSGDDVTINSASPITLTLGAATTVNSLTVSGGSTISFAGAFAFIVNSGLTFSGGTKISLTTQSAFTLGNGTATFSLTGNDASNFFTATTGNGNFGVNNNASGSINLYVDPAVTWFNFSIQKGTTTLKSNCLVNRLGLSSLNNQKLVLDNNVAFTLNGTGGSALGLNSASAAGFVDASASGSKFTFMGNGNAGVSVFAGNNRIFANGATVNHLEMNTNSVVLFPNTALKVNTLTLTTGNINNTTNNITILDGGTIIRANQNALLTAPPIFGLTSTDKVNIQYTANCTTGNELFGTTGSIGTVTVNNAVTATLSNSSVTAIALSGISGTNFTNPTVTISAPTNGIQATATCIFTGTSPNRTLLSVAITNPGYGYTSAPTVTITDATGSATGTPSINSQTGTTTIDALSIGGGTSGTVTYPNTSAKVMTLNVKDLTVNAGATFTCGTQTNNVTHLLNVGGSITNNGTFTAITTAGTKVVDVTMNGSVAQSINSAITFNGLTISNTNAKVSVGAALNTTNLTISSGAILDMQTNALSTITTTSGTGKLQTQLTTTPVPTGKIWAFNLEYNNPTGGQSVMAGTYNNGITINNTSGTNTTTGALIINGALNVNAGATFDMLGFNISTSSTLDATNMLGTLRDSAQGTSSYQFPINTTFGGTVVYYGTRNNRIVPGTYNNLNVDGGVSQQVNFDNGTLPSNGTGTITVNGTLTITGASTVPRNTTFIFNGSSQVVPAVSFYNLSLTGTGTTFPSGTVGIANTFSPGAITAASQGTISFNGSGAQTIPVFNYNNLTTATGGTKTAESNINVAATLSVGVGSILDDGGNTITVAGSISGTGTHTGTGKITMTGSSRTISGATFQNLTLSSAGTLTLSGSPTIIGTLTVTSGTLATSTNTLTLDATTGTGVFGSSSRLSIAASGTVNFNGRPVTLQSSSAGTASISTISGTLSGASNVTVERYIPSNTRRSYVLVGSPASGASIYNAWQEGGASNAGYGTLITGGAAGGTLGFDLPTTSGKSIFTYNDNNASGSKWVGLANTNATNLSAGAGYLLFVRGDRTLNLATTPTASGNTTLRATGTIGQGSISPTLLSGANKYTLIANPYPCAIDWNSGSITKTNLTGNFTVYDANNNVFVSSNGTVKTPNVGNQQAGYIQSGQAFFVQNDGTGNGAITFTEGAKTTSATTSSSTTVFGEAANNAQLNINVYHTADNSFVDGAVALFGSKYKAAVDANEDIYKFTNLNETFGLRRNNVVLGLEARPAVSSKDSLYFSLSNFAKKAYSLVIDGSNLASTTAKLEDKYTGTTTEIDVTGTTTYNFTVTDDVASYSNDRFVITFGSTAASSAVIDGTAASSLYVKMSPNPVSNQLQVSFKTATVEATSINVVNSLGQVVKTVNAGNVANGNISVPVSELANGVYSVQLLSGNKVIHTQRVVKTAN